MSGNTIGPNGMKSIADNIFRNVRLARCKIGSEGAMHLAHSILLKPVLTCLNLSENGIDSSSKIALAEGLRCCCNLQKLYLCKNKVGYDGAVALA